MKCLGHNENLGFLRIALCSIMIWFAILSYIVGIVRVHDGFYDLLTHHINSPNLLMTGHTGPVLRREHNRDASYAGA